jgi:hypothetical protein
MTAAKPLVGSVPTVYHLICGALDSAGALYCPQCIIAACEHTTRAVDGGLET